MTTLISPLPTSSRDCVVIGELLTVVILNPSPAVTLSETKGLDLWLRINSVKSLKILTECPMPGGRPDTVSEGGGDIFGKIDCLIEVLLRI